MGAMTRATFTIAAIAFLSSAAASQPPVTFESPCECRDAHGRGRLAVKEDPSTQPARTSEEWNTGLHGTLALGSLPG